MSSGLSDSSTPVLGKASWIGVILLAVVLLFNVGAAMALAVVVYGPETSYVTGEYKTLKQKKKKKVKILNNQRKKERK